MTATPFATIPDDRLAVMLHRGDPALVRGVAAAWGRLSVLLEDAAEQVAADHRALVPTWTGYTAERYAVSVAEIGALARGVARRAAAVRDVLHDAADALERAQRAVPAGVPAPARPGLRELLARDAAGPAPDPLADR